MSVELAAPSAAGDGRFAEAHRALLADSSIQFELRPYEPPLPPAWLEALLNFLQSISPALKLLLWLALPALLLSILYMLYRRFSGTGWPWGRGEPEEEDDWRPAEAAARRLLDEADRLAAEGRFSEAAHLLLFKSIEELDERRPDLLRPALTGRDLAAHPRIPDRPRGALRTIVMMVERTLFARRAIGAGEWRECRSAFEEFAFAESWAG